MYRLLPLQRFVVTHPRVDFVSLLTPYMAFNLFLSVMRIILLPAPNSLNMETWGGVLDPHYVPRKVPYIR